MAATSVAIAEPNVQTVVPDYLVKEVIDGIPVYYKDYRDVLNQTKKTEEVMADGLLQALLKMWLSNLLYSHLNAGKYWVFSGEVGSHISHNNNMSHDIAVFEKSILPAGKITARYADVPARLVVEIDTEIEYGAGISVETYVHKKTQATLDFGTEKVVWIFTASRKIMVATTGQNWIISDWDQPVDLLDGLTCNIAAFLTKEGVLI